MTSMFFQRILFRGVDSLGVLAFSFASNKMYLPPVYIFDNEKFDALQYSCDFSARGVCAIDSSAQDRTIGFDFFKIQDLRGFDLDT